jgi:uncharacterized repeat protein (TIGR01451 family)
MFDKIIKPINRILAIAVLVLSLPAWAQGALTSEMQAWLVTLQADGTESFDPATSVEPGQVIEYRTLYTNAGSAPVSGLTVIGPVPVGTLYIGGSAATPVGHVFQASIDGGSSWQSEPLVRRVTLPDGSQKEQIIPPSEYTHVRWQSADRMAADGSQEYRYRVSVEAVAEAVPQ